MAAVTTTAAKRARVSPSEVRNVLESHLLVDGDHLVMDLEMSHGAFLFDSFRQREVLDLFASFSTCALGYNHPKLLTPEFQQRIVRAAINKPVNSDVYTPMMAEFVRAFSLTVPEPLRHHMFFIEGGALAVENALKAAFDWKVRKNLAAGKGEKGQRVVHFRESFHGRSGYTLSLTNTADPRKTQYFPKFDWPRVTNPKLSFPVTEENLARVEEAEGRSIDEIKQALADYPDDIAALIVEPIQGEGGDNHFRAEFLRQLRVLADEAEFLLIFDEVQTGFGTTGRWWCFEHFDVLPDLFAFGKKTQVCGICASRRLDDVESVFQVSSRINSTWGGNLVDMVRAQRIVEVIEEEALLGHAQAVGTRLLAGLQRLERELPGGVGNARGRGMFLAFDLPDPGSRNRLLEALNENDVVGRASGLRSVRFRPPLILSDSEADDGLQRIERALRSTL
jgi:L-lysine 6-transaminase